jgi:branched-subunit amino acid permease
MFYSGDFLMWNCICGGCDCCRAVAPCKIGQKEKTHLEVTVVSLLLPALAFTLLTLVGAMKREDSGNEVSWHTQRAIIFLLPVGLLILVTRGSHSQC